MNLAGRILFAYILSIVVICSSCIREDNEECPETRVVVAIKDKNYANISQVVGVEPVDESLPFISYVNNLTCWEHKEGDQHTEQKNQILNSSSKEILLDLGNAPKGKYEVMALGNYDIPEGVAIPIDLIHELNSDKNKNSDIYLGMQQITIPSEGNNTVWLYRTKGMLLIDVSGLPSEIIWADVLVTDIYKHVDGRFNYSDVAELSGSFDLTSRISSTFKLLTAPTVAAKRSSLSIELQNNEAGIIKLSNISLDIIRNQITVVKPEYDPDEDEWNISVLVNGEWTRVVNLEIELIL